MGFLRRPRASLSLPGPLARLPPCSRAPETLNWSQNSICWPPRMPKSTHSGPWKGSRLAPAQKLHFQIKKTTILCIRIVGRSECRNPPIQGPGKPPGWLRPRNCIFKYRKQRHAIFGPEPAGSVSSGLFKIFALRSKAGAEPGVQGGSKMPGDAQGSPWKAKKGKSKPGAPKARKNTCKDKVAGPQFTPLAPFGFKA